MRSADNWPEAFGKQAILFEREAATWVDVDIDGSPLQDEWFGLGAKACRRALEIWREIEAEKQPEIDALKAQIAAITDSIREAVAERIESENDTSAWRNVASALRANEYQAWLQW